MHGERKLPFIFSPHRFSILHCDHGHTVGRMGGKYVNGVLLAIVNKFFFVVKVLMRKQ
jgi:hypothetical protein